MRLPSQYFIGVGLGTKTPIGYFLFRDPGFPVDQSPAERCVVVAEFESEAEVKLFKATFKGA